jgi:hypothetical protein
MAQPRLRMLIINFAGLGNGIWIAPILRHMDEVEAISCYFHTANPIFNAGEVMQWLNLRKFGGVVPTGWRRFERNDWAEIRAFLSSNEINVIVNLRNEGPLRDAGYFDFKREMTSSGIAFWDLGQSEIAVRTEHRLLLADQIGLFASHGIDVRGVNQLWLRKYVRHTGAPDGMDARVGFFTGASQSVKRWPAVNWLELGERLLRETSYEVVIYAGQNQAEVPLAQSVTNGLRERFGAGRCSMVAGESFGSLARDMSTLKLLVSNDTFAVHLGAAMGIPVIGLYFSTDSAIWGGNNSLFTAVQSGTGLACPDFKSDAGNCTAFYGGCPGPCKDDVSPERVWRSVAAFVGNGWDSSVVPLQSLGKLPLVREATTACRKP